MWFVVVVVVVVAVVVVVGVGEATVVVNTAAFVGCSVVDAPWAGPD